MRQNFLLMVIVCAFSFVAYTQTTTKSYNSVFQRYEYFDTNRNLIGYEKWNIVSKAWEYYDLRQTNPSDNYTPPAYNPGYDLNLIEDAMKVSRAKIDAGKARIQAVVFRIASLIEIQNELGYITKESGRSQYVLNVADYFDIINADFQKQFTISEYESMSLYHEAQLLNIEKEIRTWGPVSSSQPAKPTANKSTNSNQTNKEHTPLSKKTYNPGTHKVFTGSPVYVAENSKSRIIGYTYGTIEVISKAKEPFYKIKFSNGKKSKIGYIDGVFIE